MSDAILVTGGTGFLGGHLVSLLARRGEKVRVLTRAATPELRARGIETIEGSLLDVATLSRALQGVRRVYHCAGLVSRDPDVAPEMYRVHVEGTRALLLAARAAGVERVVLVSTSGTVAVSKEPDVSTEESPYRIETVRRWPYYLSKIYQEKLALELAATGGPEVVVINPSILFGPDDVRLSSTGDVLRFLKGEIPLVPSGGINFVDARDAAAGAILAMERGKPSARYLLGGPNWTMGEFFARLARVSGVRAPTARIPDGAARLGARLVQGFARLGGADKRAPVDPESVEIAQHYWYLDASLARGELGWEPRDPMETLDDTVRFLRERFLGGAPSPAKAPSFLETLVTRMGEPESAPAEAPKPTPRTRSRRR
ncbi:NAD-dependent epimerase/dehydratase family protein [Vulgatibacter incomptus]|uniref:Dihydroflavonol-4-reductase n=1 Tax=Vulgatibacter incomptus TaxID=1391653 RepID=A0A0K1PJG7_9BACT|nr:NAD-dependent epimerase/dehydratase family protein [Vulgatibacter incomptus]AKU93229.1 Dihydroflavonol-4-reductase [Vulgatibacter incomptus]